MDYSRLRMLAGISDNTNNSTNLNNLTELQILAGITDQQINEAREDVIAQQQGHKLLSVYAAKEKNNNFQNPLELVQYISQHTVPKYIQWTITQYIKDPKFTLTDQNLNNIKELLTNYSEQLKYKKVGEISTYTIESLRQTIQGLSTGKTGHSFNALCTRWFDAMTEADEKGIGAFIYQSGNLCIYTDLTIEGARILRRVNPNNVSLCTTYLNRDNNYKAYKQCGKQYYILTTNNLYLFFVNTKGNQTRHDLATEFADSENTHDINVLLELTKKYPIIKQLAYKIVDDIPLKIAILQPDPNDFHVIHELVDYYMSNGFVLTGLNKRPRIGLPKSYYTEKLAKVLIIHAGQEQQIQIPLTVDNNGKDLLKLINNYWDDSIIEQLQEKGFIINKATNTQNHNAVKTSIDYKVFLREHLRGHLVETHEQFLTTFSTQFNNWLVPLIDELPIPNDYISIWDYITEYEWDIPEISKTNLISPNFQPFTDPEAVCDELEQYFGTRSAVADRRCDGIVFVASNYELFTEADRSQINVEELYQGILN